MTKSISKTNKCICLRFVKKLNYIFYSSTRNMCYNVLGRKKMKNKNKRIVSLALAGILTTGIPTLASANDEPAPICQTQEDGSEYTIKEGDTLGGIAERLFGNAGYWEQLAVYNNLENPNVLYVGQIIKIPNNLLSLMNYELEYVTPAIFDDDMTYTVESGDMLGCIAKKFYGSDDRLTVDRLATYNELADPNLLYIGEVLMIPCSEKLETVVPYDYTEEYAQLAWRLDHQDCYLDCRPDWEQPCWVVVPETPCEMPYEKPCERPCPEHRPPHHHHDHVLVLKP